MLTSIWPNFDRDIVASIDSIWYGFDEKIQSGEETQQYESNDTDEDQYIENL